jgi:GT2 family glycosyltransferase
MSASTYNEAHPKSVEMTIDEKPALSVVVPTFNNLEILKTCLDSWQRFATDPPVEILVIEDGCSDGTAEYLQTEAQSPWGRRCLRWFHENDVHALRATNRGFRVGRADLLVAWQDDMFVEKPWFVRELVDTFKHYPDIGLLALSRGINFYPLQKPLEVWEDLHDPRHHQDTIGPRPLNWFRLHEVDGVIRPWVLRRQCLDKVGFLDEAFVPDEWDESDLCSRIREAGWKIAIYGYERLGAYRHLGSTTLSKEPSEKLKKRVLPNGKLFRERWSKLIAEKFSRERKTWIRKSSIAGWGHTFWKMSCQLTAWGLH